MQRVGDQPGTVWHRYAEEDAHVIAAAYGMTGAWQKCIDTWVMKGQKGLEALQAMRVSWAGLERMRPLLVHALHAMQPSQLRKDPLQAQQAVCEALRDLAATCNITAWAHARKLASQVGLLWSAAFRH